jgi:hypothetical protein
MKGVETTIPRLIVAVIICLVFFLILFPAVQKVWGYIQEKFGLTSLSPLEKAVLCAYYRCTEGCASDSTNEYCSDFWVDVCNKPEKAGLLGSDLTVCGWVAEQYPVEVKLSEDKEIGKKVGIEFTCVFTDDSSPYSIQPGPVKIAGIYLNISKSLLKKIIKREDCSGGIIKNAIEKATISGNKNIFVDMVIDATYGMYWIDVIDVSDAPKYITLPPGKEEEVKLRESQWNRIVVEGVGDVLVYPKFGLFHRWEGLSIKCPSGSTVDNVLSDVNACNNGDWFCEKNFFIKCTDILNAKFIVLYKSPATGGAAGPKK